MNNKVKEFYPEQKKKENSHFALPNGRPAQLLSNLIYYSDSTESLESFKNRTEKISHSTLVTVKQTSKQIETTDTDKQLYKVTVKNDNNNLTFYLFNNAKLTGFFRDFFIYSLIQFNKQINFQTLNCDSNKNYTVSFLVDEAVQDGLSVSNQSLKKQIDKITDYIQALKIKGTTGNDKEHQKDITKDFNSALLFPQVSVKNNVCTIVFFGGINWRYFSSSSFTYLEKCFFNMKQNEKDMILQIMQLARMNSNQSSIKKTGTFRISYRNSMKNLKLPDETKTDKSKRDIFDKIECDNAINENCKYIKITSHRSKNKGISLSQSINESYTEIQVSGELKDYLISEYEEKTKIIQAAISNKEENK